MARISELPLQILYAGHDDVPALAQLSAALFPLGCPQNTPPEDLAHYIQTELTPERFHNLLRDERIRILIVKVEEKLVGYAMVGRAAPPAHLAFSATLELRKFYIDTAYHGRGVAHALMKKALEPQADAGKSTFWLSVFSGNPRAIAFYQRCGFRIAGTQEFVVGTDPQLDYLMVHDGAAEADGIA